MRVVIFLFLLFLATSCSAPVAHDGGGGGTETTNAVIVIADGQSIHGRGPEGTVISIYDSSFNPLGEQLFNDSVTIDAAHTFRLNAVQKQGLYNMVLINKRLSSGSMVRSIFLTPETCDSFRVLLDSLGTIAGTVIREGTGNSQVNVKPGVAVYCEGTNMHTRTDSSGTFFFEGIPFGTYRIKQYPRPVTSAYPDDVVAVVSREHRNIDVVLRSGEEQ